MKMIDDINHGWASFEIENFYAPLSYLTDVPFDVMNALITYKDTGCCSVWFDCEGWNFTLTITPYNSFIISEKDKAELIELSIQPEELINTLYADIINNEDAWINNFLLCGDEEEEKKEIKNQFDLLKDKMIEKFTKDELQK